jgi:hypothetical protein
VDNFNMMTIVEFVLEKRSVMKETGLVKLGIEKIDSTCVYDNGS